MRAHLRLIAVALPALIVASARVATADPRPVLPPPPSDPAPRPPAPAPSRGPLPRTPIVITLRNDRPPIIVDAQQLPPIRLQPLARTPPPRCKKDRRGTVRC